MRQNTLSDGEWKLMNLLWQTGGASIGELVEALREDTGWTKATVNIMLGRLAGQGAVEALEGRPRRWVPRLSREEAVAWEAKSVLRRVRTGGLGLLLSTMAESCELSQAEVEELTAILREGGKKHD